MQLLRDATIIIGSDAAESERRAAVHIQTYIKLVCGVKLPVLTDKAPPRDYEIVVGRTEREETDGLDFARSSGRNLEYMIKSYGKRLYVTGFGIPVPDSENLQPAAYRYFEPGALGTLYAGYTFVEKVLDYDFMLPEYTDIPDRPDLPFPEDFSFEYTRDSLCSPVVRRFDSPAMYMLPVSCHPDWNIMSFVFRTRQGRLVVIDGGFADERDKFMKVLHQLVPDEKPVISAWLFTHMHIDHYGILDSLITDAAEGRDIPVRVENLYMHPLDEEFYMTLSKEANPAFAKVRNNLMRADKVLGCAIHMVGENEVFGVDELSFKVLRVPSMADAREMNMNDSSVVYKLTVDGGQTILFLGDGERVCSRDLLARQRDELPCDVVQVGHHGVLSVSQECYRVINAKYYLWQLGKRYYYSDQGDGIGSFNIGMLRTRRWIRQMGVPREHILFDLDGTLSIELPIKD